MEDCVNKNELMDKKKRLVLLTFLATFLFARKGFSPLLHFTYLSVIGVLLWIINNKQQIVLPIYVQSNVCIVLGIVFGCLIFIYLLTKQIIKANKK